MEDFLAEQGGDVVLEADERITCFFTVGGAVSLQGGARRWREYPR